MCFFVGITMHPEKWAHITAKWVPEQIFTSSIALYYFDFSSKIILE